MARQYTQKKVRLGNTKLYYQTRQELEDLFEVTRQQYNKALEGYGKGRQRYKVQPAGQKTYGYLEKQLKMMTRRLNTGVFEQTGGQFKNAFVQALNTQIETFGEYDSDEVFALVEIIDRMHHTQFTSFYNSLSPALRGMLFDTSNYYDTDGSNASSFAGRTIEELVKFAETNSKVREILEEVAEDYAIVI